jgi:heme/copper-type cytochrome/quinol oxidase subunit 2
MSIQLTPTHLIAELAPPVPLFGNQWLALLVILAGVALLMLVVALAGRWLAATHPDPVVKNRLQTATLPAPIPAEIMIVITSAVAATYGNKAQIASVKTTSTSKTVDLLITQWAVEGRRQIYTSHKIR